MDLVLWIWCYGFGVMDLVLRMDLVLWIWCYGFGVTYGFGVMDLVLRILQFRIYDLGERVCAHAVQRDLFLYTVSNTRF